MSRRRFGLGSAALLTTVRMAASPPRRLRILVVDGINNHTWALATRAIREILLDTGRFMVEVSTTPLADAPAEAWAGVASGIARYDAVVSNFNSGHDAKAVLWPEKVREAFEQYVCDGGGFMSYHAANNTFLLWPEYNRMIGMGWRPKASGPSVYIGVHDEVVVVPQGQGFDPNHPKRLNFQVHVRDTGHSITKGMPRVWMHPSEQLTHGQHGAVEDSPI